MEHKVKSLFDESVREKAAFAADQSRLQAVVEAAKLMANSAKSGGTIYACGNGGSACDAMHLCEELVARYKRNRPGIRALHFMDGAMLSCWSNDFSFDEAFARYADTFCTSKDVLVAISTSGNSPNVLKAATAAKAKGSRVIGLTGRDGGKLAPLCDTPIIVPAQATERIQEIHITIIHIWCELLETELGLG